MTSLWTFMNRCHAPLRPVLLVYSYKLVCRVMTCWYKPTTICFTSRLTSNKYYTYCKPITRFWWPAGTFLRFYEFIITSLCTIHYQLDIFKYFSLTLLVVLQCGFSLFFLNLYLSSSALPAYKKYDCYMISYKASTVTLTACILPSLSSFCFLWTNAMSLIVTTSPLHEHNK